VTVEIILTAIGIGLYGLASILAVLSFVRPMPATERWVLSITIMGAVSLAVVLAIHGISAGRLPAFGRFEALTCYALAITGAYLHMATRHRMPGISAILIPYVTAILVVAVPGVSAEMDSIPKIHNIWLSMHISAAFVAYSLFTLAGILAAAYIVQDYNLKHKHFGIMFERLPALETLDDLIHRQIGFAFLMLTVSIGIGVVLTRLAGNQKEWLADPKIIATIATWFLYAFLLHLRMYAKRRGKKIAWATIIGLVCILFTFVGIHLVTDCVHDFVLFDMAGK